VSHRLAHERQRSKVENAVESSRHRPIDRLAIEQIGDHELGPIGNRFAVAALEVVKNDDLVPGLEQLARDDGADVAGAARNEQLHV
jgi:hypothetical protein